ncbi:hypothetical protein P7K49_005797 [Saguinus oedipus]|uniref:Uncharacterized protein n=1 Tax=Saguinus oedipus TaxID=9490 RepID=A0ABQ9W0K7_SAGOE|nr:hypothetical protein P7K49_005797 [Saguinus oedipus]
MRDQPGARPEGHKAKSDPPGRPAPSTVQLNGLSGQRYGGVGGHPPGEDWAHRGLASQSLCPPRTWGHTATRTAVSSGMKVVTPMCGTNEMRAGAAVRVEARSDHGAGHCVDTAASRPPENKPVEAETARAPGLPRPPLPRIALRGRCGVHPGIPGGPGSPRLLLGLPQHVDLSQDRGQRARVIWFLHCSNGGTVHWQPPVLRPGS